MVFMLVIGAMIFGHFITVSGLSQSLINWVKTSGLSPLGVVTVVGVVFMYLVVL